MIHLLNRLLLVNLLVSFVVVAMIGIIAIPVQAGANASCSAYCTVVKDAKPVEYYQMNETSGSVAINSGTGGKALNGQYLSPGTALGDPRLAKGLGTSVKFTSSEGTSSGGGLTGGNYPVPPTAGSVTAGAFEAWVKIESDANEGGEDDYFMFGQNCQTILFELSKGFPGAKDGDLVVWDTGTQEMYDSHHDIADGKSHFVGLNFDTTGSGTTTLYLDAKPVESFKDFTPYGSGCPSPTPPTSAGYGPNSTFPERINETISDFAFFPNKLTAKQIDDQHSAGTTGS